MHSVIGEKRKPCRPTVLFGLFLLLLLIGHSVLLAESEQANGVLRSRAYKFSYITSQQAQELLSQLNIGSNYDVLSDNVLIVTSSKDRDLIKASEVIGVLDQPTPVNIWVLMAVGEGQSLPTVDELATLLRDFSLGTMTDAPPRGAKNPVIIDVVGNKQVAIGAEALLPEVQKAVDAWKQAHPPGQAHPESGDRTQPVMVQPETVPAARHAEQPVEINATDLPRAGLREPAETTTKEMLAEEQAPVEEAQSLQDIMTRLLKEEGQPEIEQGQSKPAEPPAAAEGEDLMKMLDTEPNTTEDYIGDELLRVLLDEEKKNRPQRPEEMPVPAKPEVAVEPKTEPQPMPPTPPNPKTETPPAKVAQEPGSSEEKSLEEAIKLLLGKQQEQQPQTEPQTAQAQPQEAEPQSQPMQQPLERPEIVSENLRLQRELAILRQQLAQVQSQKAAPQGETVELEKPQAEQVTPKIITKEEPTLTEFEKEVGEANLDTILDLPQEVELENLVDMVGKQLGLNYMYDDTIFRNQKVLLKIHGGRIKVKDLYGLLESVLRFKGYVMTRRDNLVTILKSGDVNQVAAQMDTVIRMPGDPIQPGDIIVSTIFQLKNINTAAARKVLGEMKLGLNNGFQEIAETNTLIVTDYAYRMSRIEEVLQMIDVSGEEKVFKYRAMKYMQAADLVTKLKDLVAKMEGVSMQVGDGQAAAKSAQPTRYTTQRRRNPKTGRIETVRVPVQGEQPQAAAAAAGGGEETVFIDTDERTNRVLMIGTQGQIDIINQLIDTLDVPQHDLKFVREYIIQNVEAIEVVNVLNELGLADLNVSGSSGSQQKTPSRTAAARTAAARRAQPPQAESGAGVPSVSGGADQPNISIRPATNSLLVNGTEEQHQAIELVIAHVDVVQKDQRTIREYEIQYVDTQEIIDTMTELGIISSQSVTNTTTQQRGRTSSRTSRSNQQPSAATAEGAPATGLPGFAGEEGSSEDITAQEPQIAVLEATNSLLVFATPRQHKAISLLIAHADRVPETTTTPYVVYALENQDPIELADVLTKLIQETVEEVGKTSTPQSKIQTAGGTAASSVAVPNLEEQKIRIIPDDMSYSLIVYANKRNQQWISELIDELDQYRPQVLLDCTLVEITKQDDFNFDLNILHSIPDLTNTSGFTDVLTQDSSGNPLVTKDDILTKLTNATDRSQFIDLQSNSGNFTGFYGNDKIMALFSAMQSKKYGRILANPKILVDDNQEGNIETKTTTYIERQTSNYVPTQGDPVTTTQTDFDPYDASIKLTIKPHISKGDNLRLEIEMIRSDFVDYDKTSTKPPNEAESNIKTVVTVPDSSTIILGGMDKINQGKGGDKVPLLGDIPILGGLFRSTNNTSTQNKLYIFIKPHILRPGSDLTNEAVKQISDKYRREFEEKESEMQKYDDWPGIKPKAMDPEKVLKEDELVDLTAP